MKTKGVNKAVSIGDQVFTKEGGEVFGAVRQISAHELVVDIERLGDVIIPSSAVTAVHDGKVVVNAALLPPDVQASIKHAHDEEDR
jgi:hypothetical protein